MIKFTPEQIANFPVAHLSFSAIRCYMSDRQLFFKRYIRFEFEDFTSPSMLEGKAYHKALESIWNHVKSGGVLDDKYWKFVNDIAHQYIVTVAEAGNVDFGKTGSTDKSIKVVEQVLRFYRAELPQYVPVHVESKVTTECADLNGEILPIPLKIVYDLVANPDLSALEIVDHKLVTTYKDEDEGSAAFELQAGSSFFTAWAQFGRQPCRMVFDQLKKSKNSDGTPQRHPYIINFFDDNGNPHPCLVRFLEVYRRVVMELAGLPLIDEAGTMRFIPNPFDMMSGEESWLDFCKEVEDGSPVTAEQIQLLKAKTDEVEALFID